MGATVRRPIQHVQVGGEQNQRQQVDCCKRKCQWGLFK